MDKRLLVEPLLLEAEAVRWTTEAERQAAASFAPQRRREYLAWRAVVRRELGPVGIGYDAAGAPHVEGCEGVHIGVSHGAGRVALVFSDRPSAVDIECLDRPFDRLLPRYLAPEERCLSTDPRFPVVAWSAKEVLYKLAGERGLDLRADLRLTAAGNDWIEGCIRGGDCLRLSVRYFEDDAVVVWRV